MGNNPNRNKENHQTGNEVYRSRRKIQCHNINALGRAVGRCGFPCTARWLTPKQIKKRENNARQANNDQSGDRNPHRKPASMENFKVKYQDGCFDKHPSRVLQKIKH